MLPPQSEQDLELKLKIDELIASIVADSRGLGDLK
jgi:hypothetical protein